MAKKKIKKSDREIVSEAQSGRIINDNMGQWKYPGEITRIQGNTMATHGYGDIPLYVIPNKGEPKLVLPNTGVHKFKGADSFTEYPIMQAGGRAPIITHNPNDPRLQAYNDSFYIHNAGEAGERLYQRYLQANNLGNSNFVNYNPQGSRVSNQEINNIYNGRFYDALRNLTSYNNGIPPLETNFNVVRTPVVYTEDNNDYNPPRYTRPVQPYIYKPRPKQTPISVQRMEGLLSYKTPNLQLEFPSNQGMITRQRQPGERFSALYTPQGEKYSAVDVMDKSGKLVRTIDPKTGKLAFKNPVTGEEQFEYGGELPEAGSGYKVIRSNERKGKTHKVIGPDGTVKFFGDSKLGQHPKDPARKKAFYARHAKNLKNNPYFRAFARKTWKNGGEVTDDDIPIAQDGTMLDLFYSKENENEKLLPQKQWLENWINHPEYEKRLASNLKEINDKKPFVTKDIPYSFPLTFGNDYWKEKATETKQNALKRLSKVKDFYAEGYDKNINLAAKYAKSIFPNEPEDAKYEALSLLYGSRGEYKPFTHSLFVNSSDATPSTGVHEYTHSTGMDSFLKPLIPQAKKVTEDYKRLEKENPGFKITYDMLGNPMLSNYQGKGFFEKTKYIPSDSLKLKVPLHDIKYLNKSNEVYPRIMELRYNGQVKPGQIIDKKSFENIKKLSKDNQIFDMYSDDEIIELMNKLAQNSENQELNKAAQGGMLPDLMEMAAGGQFLTVGGEYHRIYKNADGDIMVNHHKEDKGKWDTINLTDKAGAKTVAEGVAATKKWHRENPYAFGGRLPKAQEGFRSINDNPLVQAAKIFDPTGISSYPDVYYAGKDFYNNPSWSGAANVGINVLGALPMIGKLAMPAKLTRAAAKTADKATGISKGVNAVIDTAPELIPFLRRPTEIVQDFTSKKFVQPFANAIKGGGKMYKAEKINTINSNADRINLLNNLSDLYSIFTSGNSDEKKAFGGNVILEKYQDGGSNWEILPEAQDGKITLDEFRPKFANSNAAIQQRLKAEAVMDQRAREIDPRALPVENKQSIVQANPQGVASKAWEIVGHPMTAISNLNKYGRIPDHFSAGSTNPLDYAFDIVNPAFYVNAAGRTLKNIVNPQTYTDVPMAAVSLVGNMVLPGNQIPQEWDEALVRTAGRTGDAVSTLPVVGASAFAGAKGFREIAKRSPAVRELVYKGINPTGYGAREKITSFIPNVIKYSMNPDAKLSDIEKDFIKRGGMSESDTNYANTYAKNRLDAWRLGLNLDQKYNTFEKIGEDTYRIDPNKIFFNKADAAHIYGDVQAAKILGKNKNNPSYKQTLQERIALKNLSNDIFKKLPESFDYNMYPYWKQRRIVDNANKNFDASAYDADRYAGVAGGFRWDVKTDPENFLHFQLNDTWDLHPFAARGQITTKQIGNEASKALREKSNYKMLEDIEMLNLAGGKPFKIQNNFIVDPKNYQIIKAYKKGGTVSNWEIVDDNEWEII